MLFFDVLHGGEQHATCTAGGVVDGFGFLGIDHVNHQPHHAAWGIELTSLFVGGVSEFLDQVFVCVTDQVRGNVLIAQGERRKMLDQVL